MCIAFAALYIYLAVVYDRPTSCRIFLCWVYFFLSASRDQGGREWFPQKRAHKIFSLSIEMLDWWDKYWQSWFSISCYCCKRRRIHTKGTVSRVWREADGQFSLFLNINSFCVFLISADSLTVRKESFEKSYWVNIVFVVWELSPASGNSTSVYMIPVRSPLPTSSAAGADVSGGYQCDGTRRPAGFVKRLSLSLSLSCLYGRRRSPLQMLSAERKRGKQIYTQALVSGQFSNSITA